ncbi:hypothetical protein [Agrococcus sp. Marseille-Q4369]|uniref:hypothetical protein n=1 Tax=Agrococcus sp. Marseille-Q4369 TaxID=2810513 RepID=UPI001B8C2A52|nr:hypothetical protein [Agrococcus sp. Marseille-Q4369]QUW18110.1 hypothetical protein JSQ78_09680 [Agrococcus sp. Marseille-Q4369]
MDTVVGVVGPRDLVDHVAAVCGSQPGARIERFTYAHESEAPGIVQERAGGVDAWLFTGVIPYALATPGLTRPAGYVDYTGATLLQALVRLLRDGHEVTRLSIDTLDATQVRSVLEESDVPTEGVHTLPFRAGEHSDAAVGFHQRHAGEGTVAITCVSSVHQRLQADGIAVLRLVPSRDAILTALHQLLLVTTNQINEESQVALGLLESDAPFDELTKEGRTAAMAFAGTIADAGDGSLLLVSTYGRLSEVTGGLSSAPFLRRLGVSLGSVRVGFGVGRSAAEAETLARRALSRARSHGRIAAVASFRGDIDILLDAESAGAHVDALDQASIGVVAARVGLSVPTLERLHELSILAGGEPVTTRDIADRLGIQQRTARRIAQRLELAGVAQRDGSRQPTGSGRPLTLYRLHL